jgi:hypothetical protein
LISGPAGVTLAGPFASTAPHALFGRATPSDLKECEKFLLGRRNVFLRQRRPFAKEELLHLLHQKLLSLGSPGLEPLLIQQHFLVVYPLTPCGF